MRRRDVENETWAEAARYEAQKLAFSPLIFQATLAMRDLGVLECLYKARAVGVLPAEVVEATGLTLYAASLMLEAGYAAGLCAYEEPRFTITKVGVLWLKDKLTRVNADFSHRVCYSGAFHFEESMRAGLPAGLRELGPWPTVYEGLGSLPHQVKDAWLAFDHFYSDGIFDACLARVLAGDVKHVVDIGGNTGRFSRLCLAASPDVKVTLVDLPGQVALAQQAFEADGQHRARLDLVGVNVLDENVKLPPGADVYWMSQFLDCFSESQIVSILRRVREAMPEHARVVIVETFWDKQKHDAARYCVIGTSLYFACIANGNSRMYHSAELRRLVREAGLTVTEELHDVGLAHSLLECRR